MLVMSKIDWDQMRNSPATRGLKSVAEGTREVGGFLLKITFKPAFMSHAQNPDNKLDKLAKYQFYRLLAPFYVALFSGARVMEWNGQLNPQNVAFALGAAFLAAGLVDMAGLGLQAIGESKKE